jgi:hypothetical protein
MLKWRMHFHRNFILNESRVPTLPGWIVLANAQRWPAEKNRHERRTLPEAIEPSVYCPLLADGAEALSS